MQLGLHQDNSETQPPSPPSGKPPFPMAFLIWNFKGLNSPATQLEAKEIIWENSVDVFSLLETKIKTPNAQDFYGSDWDPLNNALANSPDPDSIFLFWRKGTSAQILITHSQIIHTCLTNVGLELENNSNLYSKLV